MHTASTPSAPIAVVGGLLAALAIASLARLRPPEPPPAPAATHETRPRCLDINQADAAALEALPRVGPSLAARILQYRQTNGAFDGIDALDQVRGIGPATLRVLRPHLCEVRVSTGDGGLPDAGPPR